MRGRSALVRVVALLLIVTYPATSFAFFELPAGALTALQYPAPAQAAPDSTSDSTSDTCSASHSLGRKDASARHSSTKWFFGGFFSGVLLGVIGTTVITICAATTDPFPKQVPANVETACYVKGYEGKGKSKNTWGALEGGLLGTLVFVVIYTAVSDD